jgi:hypothetical protein
MSARTTVIGWLTQRVGFPFSESELSPVLRRRVGEISDIEQRIYGQTYLIGQKMAAVANLRSRKTSQTLWLVVSAVLGALLLIIIVGAALFVVTYIMYRRREKTEQLIRERTLEIANLNSELATLKSTLDTRLTAIASEIFNELSSTYGVRVASSNTGSTVQVVRETIKEIVMVPCAYCHSLIPQTSLRCPHCGATRKS